MVKQNCLEVVCDTCGGSIIIGINNKWNLNLQTTLEYHNWIVAYKKQYCSRKCFKERKEKF